MANRNEKIKMKDINSLFRKKNQSDIRGIQTFLSGYAGFVRNLRIAVLILLAIVPLLIIAVNINKAKSLSNEAEKQPSFGMGLPLEPVTVQMEPNKNATRILPAFLAPFESSRSVTQKDPQASDKITAMKDSAPSLTSHSSAQQPLFSRSKQDKVAYITIDDGPSRAITPAMLDILDQEGIKATFFVLPHSGVDDIYRRIIDEGHEIGNHSYSHVYSKLYNIKDIEIFREDVLLAQAFVFDNFGYLMTSFRFPGGAMSRTSEVITPRREILTELGYRDFDWNVESGDANSKQKDKSADALTENVLNNTRGRKQLIVLMHDSKGKETTLEALPLIISGLREQGYTFDILRNYPIEDNSNRDQ